MNEVLKKIDEMKNQALKLIVKNPHDTLDSIQNDVVTGYVTACDELADFVLAEQKTPCYSLNDCEYKKDGSCFIFSPCPHQTKPLTNGDKIREDNESLSAFIRGQFGDDRVFHNGNTVDLDDYLNQPQEGEQI